MQIKAFGVRWFGVVSRIGGVSLGQPILADSGLWMPLSFIGKLFPKWVYASVLLSKICFFCIHYNRHPVFFSINILDKVVFFRVRTHKRFVR